MLNHKKGTTWSCSFTRQSPKIPNPRSTKKQNNDGGFSNITLKSPLSGHFTMKDNSNSEVQDLMTLEEIRVIRKILREDREIIEELEENMRKEKQQELSIVSFVLIVVSSVMIFLGKY
jgi:hypothetical protein